MREVQRERAAPPGLALDAHEAAVAAHRVIDDRQAEAGALRPAAELALDAIELAEDASLLAPRECRCRGRSRGPRRGRRRGSTSTSISLRSPEYFIALASRFSIACSAAPSSASDARQVRLDLSASP